MAFSEIGEIYIYLSIYRYARLNHSVYQYQIFIYMKNHKTKIRVYYSTYTSPRVEMSLVSRSGVLCR